MKRIRVIPALLSKDGGLVKTVQFKDAKYVGDPINIIKIFNDKEVDELIFLDINATANNTKPSLKVISEIASECFMPICYGGGIKSTDHIKEIFNAGVEKVAINTSAIENPSLIDDAVRLFGSQSIVVSMDVKKNLFGKQQLYKLGGRKKTKLDPVEFATEMEKRGAGEILLNSIDKDGTYLGYDIKLIKSISEALKIPVIACGGASKVEDFVEAVKNGASAVAAGSMFVFHGKHRAVLINFPSNEELKRELYSLR